MAQDIRFDIFEDERESDMLEQIQQNLFGENNAYDQDILIVDTELNGLSSFEVFYHGRNACYEVWLSLPIIGDSHSLPSAPQAKQIT